MAYKSELIFEIEPENKDQELDLSQITIYNPEDMIERVLKVRLDKWLWAARFFKTRALARAAIENGKISYDGQKVMPSKEIEVGATLIINQGRGKKIIVIRGLSTRRRSTDEANALFEEIHGSEMSSEQNFNIAYAPIQEAEMSKPKKLVRFLRRTMAIGDTSSNHAEYEQKDSAK
jgi:ribosome-associated heat shock protein Hsp15